jgi:hypothetical protein
VFALAAEHRSCAPPRGDHARLRAAIERASRTTRSASPVRRIFRIAFSIDFREP